MADVQLEHGHIRIAREFFDALLRQRLTGREWTVFMAVLRLTWGWQRKSDRIGSRQIAAMTGIGERHVRNQLRNLRRRKMLARRRDGQWYRWGIVKDFEKWTPEVRPSRGRPSRGRPAEGPQSATVEGPQSATVEGPTPKQERNKEIRRANSRPQSQSQLTHIGETLRTLSV